MANTYPEPYRSAPKDSLVDPSTCYNRECVSYCAWKIREAVGRWLKRTGDMNAKNWIYRLPENGFTKVVPKPINGGKYVGVSTAGAYGHVLWFEHDTVISEYNYNYLGNYGERKIDLNAYRWYEIVAPPVQPAPAPQPPANTGDVSAFKVGDVVEVTNPVDTKGTRLATSGTYNVVEISNGSIVIGRNGAIIARIYASNLRKVGNAPAPTPTPPANGSSFAVGDKVVPTQLVDYDGRQLQQWDASYTITELKGDRAVLSARGAIWAAMNVKNIRKA